MSTIVHEEKSVEIPAWVVDLDSFRRWARSDDFPEEGRICYLGEVWIDMSKEQLFSHSQVKLEITLVLGTLAKGVCPGFFFPDGVLISNVEADLSCQPDGLFISSPNLEAGRVRFVEGSREGYVELEGSPDMVLEVVSSSSVHKDTVRLKEFYWKAGVPEYWLVDARRETLIFEIFKRQSSGYEPTEAADGWLESKVFQREFRLIQSPHHQGHLKYALEMN